MDNIRFEISEIKKRGRKAKYSTAEEKKNAKKEQTKASNKRRYALKGEGAKREKEIIRKINELQRDLDEHRLLTGRGWFGLDKGFQKVADFGKAVVNTTTNAVNSAVDTFNSVVPQGVKNITNQAKDITEKVLHGRKGLPPKVISIFEKYGGFTITGMTIGRTPVPQVLSEIMNVVSLGSFKKKFGRLPYDKLFHLFLIIDTTGGRFILEKNEVINADTKVPSGAETKSIPNIPQELTPDELLEKTKEYMGDKFIPYSANNNNCQDFVLSVLKSNHIGDEADYSFVKQDTTSLFKNDSFLRKVANTATDLGARVDVLKQGGDIPDYEDLDWGSLTKQFKVFKSKNKDIKDLEQFAKYILDNPSKFQEKTLKRARFYVNVILHKKGGLVNTEKLLSNNNTKMANKWIEYVKAFAKKHGIKYNEALKSPACKEGYKSGSGVISDLFSSFGLGVGEHHIGRHGTEGSGTKKGNRRKGASKGARLAFDALHGRGIPTDAEQYDAALYNQTRLGMNAGVPYSL